MALKVKLVKSTIGSKKDQIATVAALGLKKIGDESIIYKAKKEQSLYQFNANTMRYEKLSDGTGIDNITIINGGNA